MEHMKNTTPTRHDIYETSTQARHGTYAKHCHQDRKHMTTQHQPRQGKHETPTPTGQGKYETPTPTIYGHSANINTNRNGKYDKSTPTGNATH